MKTALICGVSGQDGAYLARHLLNQGYRVVGTSRDAQTADFRNLGKLGIRERVAVASMVLTDFRSTLQTLAKTAPDEIYNLAGQTSVGLSFEQPVETLESIATGTLNLLEAIRFLDRPIRLYNAGSSQCFGDTGGVAVITPRGAPWVDLVTYGCGWWIGTGVDPLVLALRTAMALSDEVRRAMGKRGRVYVQRCDCNDIAVETLTL